MDEIKIQQGSKKDLGITILVVSVILIIYVLFNGIYRKNILGLAIVNRNKTINIDKLLLNSETIMTNVFILFIATLHTILLTKQDFQRNIYGIIAIISVILTNIVIIFMNLKNNYILTISFFIFSYFYVLFTNINYTTTFDYKETNELNIITIVTTFFLISSIILFGLKNTRTRLWDIRIYGDLFGISGCLYVIAYLVQIYYLSIYPSISATPL